MNVTTKVRAGVASAALAAVVVGGVAVASNVASDDQPVLEQTTVAGESSEVAEATTAVLEAATTVVETTVAPSATVDEHVAETTVVPVETTVAPVETTRAPVAPPETAPTTQPPLATTTTTPPPPTTAPEPVEMEWVCRTAPLDSGYDEICEQVPIRS